MRTYATIPALCLLLLPLTAGRALADHFGFRKVTSNGHEWGIVTGHGMDLFVITSAAGGFSPVRRAQIVAARLEDIASDHDMSGHFFNVGLRNGLLIIQQFQHTDHPPHLVVTVDSGLAHGVSVENLAEWWLALLKDHLALAAGIKPFSTVGTPVGDAFLHLYAGLDSPHGPVPSEDIDRAFASLPADQQTLLRTACLNVPPHFQPRYESDLEDAGLHPDAGGDNSAGAASDQNGSSTAPSAKSQGGYRYGENGAQATGALSANQVRGASQAGAGDADQNQPPDASAGAASIGSDSLTRDSGDYRVTVDPGQIVAGRPAAIGVTISRISTGKALGSGTVVRAWAGPADAPVSGMTTLPYDSKSGEFLLKTTIGAPGAARIVVGAVTSSGDAIRVPVALTAVQPGAAGAGKGAAMPLVLQRRSGAVKVTVRFGASRLVEGSTQRIHIDLFDDSSSAALADLSPKVWLGPDGDDQTESAAVTAAPSANGGYDCAIAMGRPGDYLMIIEAARPGASTLRVVYRLTVAAADTGSGSSGAGQTQDPGDGARNPPLS
ncbi:MAG TPA: hypothetical protein VGS41_10395 [Chthonomonadales bacterium]|nr:hypothetical protein [Chthonomonadales bacterium]